MSIFTYLRHTRKHHPTFFIFICFLLGVYFLQFIFKIEITPLGYFSLYSNPTKNEASFKQILPRQAEEAIPINIYKLRGSAFIMMEILPTRYKILSESENCNQMGYKLRKIGLSDTNDRDCQALKLFNEWFVVYSKRLGINLSTNYVLCSYGFKNGKLVDQETVLPNDEDEN